MHDPKVLADEPLTAKLTLKDFSAVKTLNLSNDKSPNPNDYFLLRYQSGHELKTVGQDRHINLIHIGKVNAKR